MYRLCWFTRSTKRNKCTARLCTLVFFFPPSHLVILAKCAFKCISKMSGRLLLFRSLWCKTELLLLLRTAGRAITACTPTTTTATSDCRSTLHINTPGSYSCYYGVAFILPIGVFVLQAFLRNKSIIEADGLVHSQGKTIALGVVLKNIFHIFHDNMKPCMSTEHMFLFCMLTYVQMCLTHLHMTKPFAHEVTVHKSRAQIHN